ncbi:MAG: hypothetical protein H8D26_05985 [Methanomicrobia archaeon]|nr:hypothetical protein [Methanomicrobia archaeon]
MGKNMNAEVMSRVEERTLGCSTSPKHYKHVFKQPCEGRGSDTSIVLAHNSSDVDQQTWACLASSRDYLALNCPQKKGADSSPSYRRGSSRLLDKGKSWSDKRQIGSER